MSATTSSETQGTSTRERRKPSPLLRRLDALAGEWEMAVSKGGRPMGRSRTTFVWLHGAFLVQNAEAPPADPSLPPEWVASSPLPITTVYGLDDTSELFTLLYADARGVHRTCQMSLNERVWKVWRDVPGFFQRFTGTFDDDGKTIVGRWELSPDGSTWSYDFDVTYTKVA